ncbi:hypothetical protein [Haloarchaeobius amylolyticus]|uniref:hypothetical protein n=1 Tax=Haloarchaeobius amylolyticus TaxID=1198296 RepID=UPI002271E831|nr:hypothetical protein [Haloarchaeobius amylolyticus]
MLGSPKIRKAVSAATAAYGLLSLIAPRKTVKIAQRVVLSPTFENTGELEPRDWYVESARASGLGMLVGGLFGYILADRAGDKAEAAKTEPVELDVDEAAEDEAADADEVEDESETIDIDDD